MAEKGVEEQVLAMERLRRFRSQIRSLQYGVFLISSFSLRSISLNLVLLLFSL